MPGFFNTPAVCSVFSERRAGLRGGTRQPGPEAEDLLPGEQPGAAHQGPQAGTVFRQVQLLR